MKNSHNQVSTLPHREMAYLSDYIGETGFKGYFISPFLVLSDIPSSQKPVNH